MESQILRGRLFSICSHFFGAHSFSKKCVRETTCVLPADTESNQNNRERAWQAATLVATF